MMLKVVAAVLAVGACVGTAALAQDDTQSTSASTPTPTYAPTFERPPRINSSMMPPRATIEDRRAGFVDLCCPVHEDRSVECHVGREWPERVGFGAAAMRFAQNLRLTQQAYDDLQQRGASSFQLPVVYLIFGMRRRDLDELNQALVTQDTVCGAGVPISDRVTITTDSIPRSRS